MAPRSRFAVYMALLFALCAGLAFSTAIIVGHDEYETGFRAGYSQGYCDATFSNEVGDCVRPDVPSQDSVFYWMLAVHFGSLLAGVALARWGMSPRPEADRRG